MLLMQRLGKGKCEVIVIGLSEGEMTIVINFEAIDPRPVHLNVNWESEKIHVLALCFLMLTCVWV